MVKKGQDGEEEEREILRWARIRKIESFSLEIFMILLDSVSYRCRYPSWNAESTMKIFMLYKLKFYYRVSEKIAGKL